MRKRIITISCFAYLIISYIFSFNITIFADSLEPDPLLLELEELYRGEKQYKQLPLELEDPYKRPKNGPALKNVIHKANMEWLKKWISNPKDMVPNARMPRLMLNDDEIEAVLAYLESIADKELPKQEWDSYLMKSDEDMSDEEYEKMDELVSGGKAVWGRARCNLCHPVKGKGGAVGVGPDLGTIAEKINRDWLYLWIKEPKSYFHDTQMPRYRFDDKELRKLVEFIMRDWDFKPEEDYDEEESESIESVNEEPEIDIPEESSTITQGSLVEKGKKIIELKRCFLCHEIEGISELLPINEKDDKPKEGFEKLLNDIMCLTCHNIQGKGGTFAPELTHEGSKLKETWIKSFLQNPDIIRPLLKQMPKFNMSIEEAETTVKFVEKFFINKKIPLEEYADIEPTEEEINRGKELYVAKGCRSCHTISDGGVVGPTLKKVGDRLENGFIFYHLKDPHLEIPDAVEPNYNLTDEEAKAITHFLMFCKSEE
jgi:mono/diheme cytochrome c family protein